MLTVGPFAIETYEPRQVRNEAAVSKIFYVPEDTLTRANCQSNAWRLFAEVGCTAKKKNSFDSQNRITTIIIYPYQCNFKCQTVFGIFFMQIF